MIKIYTSLDRYKSIYYLSTWLYTIAKRVIIDWKWSNNHKPLELIEEYIDIHTETT